MHRWQTTLRATVTACEANEKDGTYCVQLDDTVLFPEGGGQPDDRGKVRLFHARL